MEMTRLSPFRGFSVRSILGFALAVIVTVLLWTILASPAAHAEDAEWNGASIKYNGIQYISAGKIQSNDGSGLTVDSPYYMYIEKYQAPGSNTKVDRARIIYFSPGVDPPTATTAKSVYFYYDTQTKTFSNPHEQKDITLTPQASSSNSAGTSCAIEGIGWIVCPIMNFLAGGMDFIFSVIAQYMEVQPLETGNLQSSLYSAWGIMRNIANVVFIIVFLILIYAQITSYKTNEFGFKRLLPRLIIAAVAINISYIICAVAVDVSNVLGYSLQDIFYNLRDQILDTGSTDNTAQILSWQSVTGFVISGGTAALAGLAGLGGLLVASGGSIVAAVFLLLPSLMGLLIAVLVVLLILAARQALIIILVIIAPIAIVLYLLPNTEKWFGKWRDLFMTLLIFFPAFSVVFGGSQLAGAVIIKNATSINLVILGMIVQVAPLVITPLLLKFSGSLLGAVARLVNDPNKGLIDRTRKWSGEHAEHHRKRAISGRKWNGDPGDLNGRNVLRKSARYLDQRKQRRGDLDANSDTAIKTNYENSKLYARTDRQGNEKYNIATQKAAFEADKAATHDAHSVHVEHAKRTPGSLMYNRAMNVEAGKESLQSEQNVTAAFYNTQRAIGGTALNTTSVRLEQTKLTAEIADNNKNLYISQEKQRVGSTLHGMIDSYESSKLKLDGSQSRYTAMVDELKIDTSKELHLASINAQSGKDQVEFAQQKLQAMFDDQRITKGTTLSVSMENLEIAKAEAEGARAKVATYLATQKSEVGTNLHTVFTTTEQVKQVQQTAEAKLTRIVEEYRAGGEHRIDEATGIERVFINNQEITGADLDRANAMRDEAARVSAENQGLAAAKYETSRNIAQATYGDDTIDPAFTNELLTAAQGIGGQTAKLRAQAQALKQLDKLDDEALNLNVELLQFEAATAGSTIKKWSAGIVSAFLGGDKEYEGKEITDERLKAAFQAQAEEKNMSIFEDARRNRRVDQSMLSSIIARNKTNFKVAGGFHLQEDPSLNIDNFATEAEFDKAMAYNRMQSLGNTAASNMSGVKMGWLAKFADPANLEASIAASLADGAEGENHLRKVYTNVREALTNPQIRATIGDRENEVRAIEARLADLFGQDAVDDDRPPIHRP